MKANFRALLLTHILVLGALHAGCSHRAVSHDVNHSITTATLATLLNARVPMALFDARTGAHDDGRRIPGAVSLAPDAPADEIARLTKAKDGLVVTYCKDPQCPNFAVLASRLRQLGYANVLENPEGIEGWAKEGLNITMDAHRAQARQDAP